VAGGSKAGGSLAGGSKTGGSVAGGSSAGGSLAAGTTTGGSVAGGSKMGGSVAGGTTTGGVASGGVATGGKTSTGSPGGAAGGAIVMPATGTYPVSAGTPTIYLAGDSTCQTYATNAKDQQGWGQRFQEFFNTSDVLVVNKAIGGRSSKSFIDEGHLTEILNVIKPGDYLFAQWGINDRYTSDATRYTNPATTFRTYLKQYIDGARGKNAIPVLLTPTPRHQLSNGLPTNGFAEYCAAIIAVGAETNTPVIDLQSMALAYYTKVGDAYVTSTIILDALHFVSAGAYQMARMVALGVSAVGLPISPKVIQSKLAAH
jgi:lysophospholipase L1-like esterase